MDPFNEPLDLPPMDAGESEFMEFVCNTENHGEHTREKMHPDINKGYGSVRKDTSILVHGIGKDRWITWDDRQQSVWMRLARQAGGTDEYNLGQIKSLCQAVLQAAENEIKRFMLV